LGDTHVVSVGIADGEFTIEGEVTGDSVSQVLDYVEYDAGDLASAFRASAEKAVRKKKITPRQRREVVALYDQILRGYTYFNDQSLNVS
jgi:arginine decarboxylase